MGIAVCGAAGQAGREVAFCLQQRNIPHRLLVRDPKKASFLEHPTSEIIPFDFTKEETHPSALKGTNSLFLVANSSVPEKNIISFLNTAKGMGVEKIVVMSGIGADKREVNFLTKLEALVNLPSVSLRANWFFQNFSSVFNEMITKEHLLTFPDGGAPISFVDARDIAEVAVHFLTSNAPFAQQKYAITGPESLTHAAVAELFSKHLPYQVGYQELSEEEARTLLGWTDEWMGLFDDIRNGVTAPVSGVVEEFLGEPARKLEAYITEHLSDWTT